MTKKEIEKKARECLELINLEIPVPVIEIAEKLGLEVHEVVAPDEESLSQLSVALVKNDRHWLILVNEEEIATRKRFAIAHAVGHFLLHPKKEKIDSFVAGETIVLKDVYGTEEKEASYFALALLMPTLELKEAWQKTKDAETLSKQFYVSQVSLTARLQALNLVEGVL